MNRIIKNMARISLITAFICIVAPMSILTQPVPFTMQMFMLFLTAMILPTTQAVTAIGLYIFLGALGFPVFAGYVGGFAYVTSGLTSGYIWAFPTIPLFFGVLKKIIRNEKFAVAVAVATSFTFVCFVGVWQMNRFWIGEGKSSLDLFTLFKYGYFPFIPFNMIISGWLAYMIASRTNKIIKT